MRAESRLNLSRRALLGAAAASAFAFATRAWSLPAAVADKLARRMAKVDAVTAHGPFHADWESLAAYRVPEWFRDAKFGVFLHWGVYSVPAFANEWYSRNLYQKGSAAYEYHRAVYGPQSKFGYKDFIPMFKAEKFDPDAWVRVFQEAGVRYVVPVAEHCDGFPMYDSDFTDWDAAKMGPKRDVVGALEKATRAKGLHFGLSSHRAEHWWWYNLARSYDTDVNDPRFAGLYGPAEPRTLPGDNPDSEPDPSHLERWNPPSKAFLDDWLARCTELVDKYRPEFIYLDWWINAPGFEPYLRKLAAYYYDEAGKRGQGPVLAYKEDAFPPGAALLDIERGKLDELRLLPWQTDTSVSVNSWGYVRDDKYRTAKSLVAELIDVVSKNGNLLLNVGPKADGTLPEEATKVLAEMGQWLKVNGEAIYGTRPWKYYGEGTTNAAAGSMRDIAGAAFTPADIRFTTKGETLYALGLEPPKDGPVTLKTLYKGSPYLDRGVAKVELVGANAAVSWEQTPTGLVVHLPAGGGDMPYALRITLA
jgi:alpha-L-fucosidase